MVTYGRIVIKIFTFSGRLPFTVIRLFGRQKPLYDTCYAMLTNNCRGQAATHFRNISTFER
jgi:hypothetical protein